MELVKGVQKLAVLRANAIGDYLVSLPALEALRAGTPSRAGAAGGRLARRLPRWSARPGRPLPGRAADGRRARRLAAGSDGRSSGSLPACGPRGST